MSDLFNIEIEEAVIGCIVFEPDLSIHACNEHQVTEDWFYNPLNAITYKTLITMSVKGVSMDLTAISEYVKRNKIHVDMDKLESILAKTITATSVVYYIGKLREYWLLRKIDAIASNAKRRLITDQPQLIVDDLIVQASNLNHRPEIMKPEDYHKEFKKRRELARQTGYSGYPSRFLPLNELIGSYNPPDNVIIAARPSTGKTAFILNEITDKAEHYNMATAVASLDMDEYSLRMRMAGEKAEVNTFQFRTKFWTDEDAFKVDSAFEYVNTMPIFINDRQMNIDQLVSWTIHQKAKHNIGMLVVDFIQQVSRNRDELRMPKTEVLGGWSSILKALGKRLNITTVLLSQLNRSDNKDKDVTPQHPSLENLRDSGELEQNADIVILMCKRPNVETYKFSSEYELWDIDFDVAKNRNGSIGLVPMSLWTTKQRFVGRGTADDMRNEGIK